MASITWPSSFLLSVLILCAAGLSWKGLIPIHAFLTVAGLILGYLIPKGGAPISLRHRGEGGSSDTFMRDEVPTKKNLSSLPPASETAKKES
jgi:hypothetical protein